MVYQDENIRSSVLVGINVIIKILFLLEPATDERGQR